MDDPETIRVTINVAIAILPQGNIAILPQGNIAILPQGNSVPEDDDTAPADGMHAEPRTRQQHAADDPAGTLAADK